MVYSCAYFENGDEDLATAQLKKIDHILTKIQLQPGQRLLDIGCGWGALVIRAAQKFGAKCVGVTLSQNQFDLATQRVKDAGLEGQVEIRLQDYRDIDGQFDRITSVGMFEHVGRKNLPGYFQQIHDLLADDGVAMNHGITSTDAESGETALGGGEFIDRYVFPDGELPHIGLALESLQRGGLEAVDVESLRRHYARTLDIWAERFETHAAEAQTARRRREIPHLARVSGGLCLRVRKRRRVDLSDRLPQGRTQRNDAAVVAPVHVREGALNAAEDEDADVEQADLFGVPAAAAAVAPTPRKPRGVLPAPVAPELDALAQRLPAAVHLGTSTWSFPGWRGIVYGDDYANAKLSRDGLNAYGAHPLLRCVSIDRSFYAPLSLAEYARYAEQVPAHFRFIVKAPASVTDAVVRGERGVPAGDNPAFLNAQIAIDEFVRPCIDGLGAKAGALVFQFSPLPDAMIVEPARFIDEAFGFPARAAAARRRNAVMRSN